MGYYTEFSLMVTFPGKEAICFSDKNNLKEFEDLVEKIQYELHALCGYGEDFLSRNFNDSVKWYEHENDMRELSIKNPKVLFSLCGQGESSEDLWVKHFKNGKMQLCKAQVIIPPYDPEKMI